jgi:hypothetical protein
MLTQVHLLLTYTCNWECDHCFLYCAPDSPGTFTLAQIRRLFDQLVDMGTVEWVYFEGGEPFLFYPILVEGVKMAHSRGFKTGVVSNAYWATCTEDATFWLRPLAEADLTDMSLSDDPLHYDDEHPPAEYALEAASIVGFSPTRISLERPSCVVDTTQQEKGVPILAGDIKLVGRAVEKLLEGLPRRSSGEFTECPLEKLDDPERVHVDPYGHVHLCQGILMGNVWETPLSTMARSYDPQAHSICGPLLRGGPARLADELGVVHEDSYVDACHFCYMLRLALLDRFPEYLGPPQVYGLSAKDQVCG